MYQSETPNGMREEIYWPKDLTYPLERRKDQHNDEERAEINRKLTEVLKQKNKLD